MPFLTPLSGTITAVNGTTVTVTCPAHSTDRPFEAPFLAPGGTPTVGAECVLIFDERSAPLALVPGSGP